MLRIKSLFKLGRKKKEMSTETLECGKRTYVFESHVTKNGHKYIMLTEKSFGRMSKIMVFHDHLEDFRSALERISRAEPLLAETSVN
jgi:hypothetical protein